MFTQGVEPKPEQPSNIAKKVGFKKGTSEEAFRLADVIMERRYSTQPVHQVYRSRSASRPNSTSTRLRVLAWANDLLADHDIRRLDDGPGVIADLEREIVDGIVGDRRCDDHSGANVDANVSRRLALGNADNFAFELVACAELHCRGLPFE